MLKESRQYQLTLETNIPQYLKQFGSTIVQLPTGGGKSHIINKTVKRILAAGKTALVLSDTVKIHQQLVRECKANKIDATVKHASILQGYCYVAMVQTLQNRDKIIEQFKMLGANLVVIIDECHRNTATKLVHEIAPKYLVGFSATPHWKWAKHLEKIYKSIICGEQISALVNDGYLAHYKHLIRSGAELDKLQLSGRDFSEESQDAVFGSNKMYDGVFEDMPKFLGRKCVIFTASIKMCEQMHTKLLDQGYRVCRYHSELPNRAYELAKFTEMNEADICVSVGALTLGWDYPPIDTVILWRATTSLPLYLQMIGRGSRPYPGKDMFTVLDYGGNFERFGAWDMDRDWNSLWTDPKKRRSISTYAGVSGSKLCPICQALLAVTARSCYNCGYMYPESELELIDGKLLEVKNTLAAINTKRIGDLTPTELAAFAKYKDKKQFAFRVAKSKHQTDPKFLVHFAEAMGYDKGWVDHMIAHIGHEKIDFSNIIIRC
jgi:superfamily II DNA or RNA helicase